jgi:hypothetical protein
LKNAVDTAGSRWLDLEWHRAHALLLSDPEASETVASEVLLAWGEVLAAAREMRFPGAALEACSHCAELLLQRGEKLGARSRLQDAFASFQELWSWIPESHEMSFQGRKDIHRFRQAVEAAGIRWVLPERCDPLVDWTPTQLSFSLANPHRTNS